MEKIVFNKEQFIYEIDNSITEELCSEIINKFNEDRDNKSCLHYLFLTTKWIRIKKCLITQLKIHFKKYLDLLNGPFINISADNFGNDFVTMSLDTNTAFETLDFMIKRLCMDNLAKDDDTIIHEKKIMSSIKLFYYIWFLNDYDGEIVFWRNYSVKPKAGKLLIFPISWCFPYEELISVSSEKYFIIGKITAESI